jgi:primosomal protein N' (replication factor Y)
MGYRKELQMPPYTHLMKVVVSGSNEKEVMRQIVSLCKLIESKIDPKIFKILGPAPAIISKERGQFKWNFYFKGPSIGELGPILLLAVKEVKLRKAQITIDVDPQ